MRSYEIIIGNRVITSDKLPEARLRMEISAPGSLTLKVLPEAAESVSPTLLGTPVRVRAKMSSASTWEFVGRILSETVDENLLHTYEAEGGLGVLNDTIIPPFDFPADVADDPAYQYAAAHGNVVEYFLRWLIDQHNAQARTAERVLPGTISVTDPNNYISRSTSDYMSTWEVIKTRLLGSSLGGMLTVSYELGYPTVNYIPSYESPTSGSQVIQLGDNLLGLTIESNADAVYTDIIPIGADGLTIAALPDGSTSYGFVKAGVRIYDPTARAVYGNVARVVSWPDVTQPGHLKNKAEEKLHESSEVRSIDALAYDKSVLNDTISPLQIGKAYSVISRHHGLIAEPLGIASIEIDLLNPGESRISLGRVAPTQTAAVAKLQQGG